MQRRQFIQNAALSAIAVSATSFIRFDGQRYVGDCETTSDVLGPFYRPDSPVRENLRVKGEKGDPITLMGKILHDDCTGDPWIEKDSSASSPTAKKHILEVKTQSDGSKKVEYNVNMTKKRLLEPAAMGLLVGNYTNEKDAKDKMEFFVKDHLLWIKGNKSNGMPFGISLEFTGNNTFTIPGMTQEAVSFVFDLLPYGVVKMTNTYTDEQGEKTGTVYVRAL
jgi:hypothetical protein